MLAGAYVGIGIVLIFKLGRRSQLPIRPSNPSSWERHSGSRSRWWCSQDQSCLPGIICFYDKHIIGSNDDGDTLKNWVLVFIGNLAGAILLSYLVYASGLFKGLPRTISSSRLPPRK